MTAVASGAAYRLAAGVGRWPPKYFAGPGTTGAEPTTRKRQDLRQDQRIEKPVLHRPSESLRPAHEQRFPRRVASLGMSGPRTAHQLDGFEDGGDEGLLGARRFVNSSRVASLGGSGLRTAKSVGSLLLYRRVIWRYRPLNLALCLGISGRWRDPLFSRALGGPPTRLSVIEKRLVGWRRCHRLAPL
ncbi:hypothetical protein NDU88_008572 [Pleurodeles waltl]|uniref:Uncharacterized protein n=1 Tax=Pleurodeles waltl TaxID=8319 RepID=A0AAV7QQ99_PLEWA|nr:hypothetical protein NDU88_008572 [Pleurodeles waltl]